MTVPVIRDDEIMGVIGLANGQGGFEESDILHVSLLMEAVFNVVIVKQAKEELELLSNRFKLANRVAMIGVFDWDMKSDSLFLDEQMVELYGLEMKAGRVAHSIWEKIIHPDDLNQVQDLIRQAIESKSECTAEFRTINNSRRIRLLATVDTDESGQPIRMIGANWDITKEHEDYNKLLETNRRLEDEVIERTYIEDALRVSEEKFKVIVDTSPDGIAITDMDGIVNFVTDRTVEMWGYDSKEELLGRNAMEFIHESYLSKAIYFIGEMINGNLTGAAEYLMVKKDGTLFYIEANANILKDKDGNPTGILYIERDVTERRRLEDEMKEMAQKDQLTGLFNRRKIDEVLLENEPVQTRNRLLSVIMLDIDYFKKVNDEHGHLVGDEVLVSVGQLLTDGIRQTDILGRWGGEEFIIICPDTDLSGARQLAEKLRIKISNHIFNEVGQKTCSFGVAQLKADETVDDVLSRSDSALYLAKEMGRNRVVTEEAFYTP
jgi:diguanylate cyclase (GGDEF)-like protein/PAS domain S-box-containing protein